MLKDNNPIAAKMSLVSQDIFFLSLLKITLKIKRGHELEQYDL
jgi:hypothetical protein